MSTKRKRQNNFICDPDGPWGPVYDNSLHDENVVPKIKFIENHLDLLEEDEDTIETVERIRKLFNQFRENTN